jgi:hypothetical protein
MRKFMVAAALAVLGAALLASSASAFDRHFNVLSEQKSFHGVGQNAFVDTDKLLDPNDRSSKVGRDRARCHVRPHGVRCHAVIHLNGKIGGFGDIRVRGDLGRGGDLRVNVVGGSGEFNGVAGKMTIHSTKYRRTDKLHFDLVR